MEQATKAEALSVTSSRKARRTLAVAGVLAASAMLAAACGSSSSSASSPTTTAKSTTTTAAPSSTSTTTMSSSATVEAKDSAYGKILVNSKGYTLYLLSSEANGAVKCTGGCLKIWLPVTLPSGMSKPVAGMGVKGTLGVIMRSDGTKQVTDNGYPLYTFVKDTKPGQTNGEGIKFPGKGGGVWYVVSATSTSPSTTAVKAKASSGSSYSSGY
jgi:predicted lipoprotein with Yx(FWY)xxD motif